MAQPRQRAAAGARLAARSGQHVGAPSLAAHRARLRAVIEPVVATAGLDLDDLTVSRAGQRHVVRVTVDGDGGVSHETLSEISRDVSSALDAAEDTGGELVAGSYTLEVSSPGVDRPLTLARHWRRNIGRLVKVKAGERAVTARVAAVSEKEVTLDEDGRLQTVGFDQLGPGRVQVEFGRLAELDDADLAVDFEDGVAAKTEDGVDAETEGEDGA